MLGQEKADWIRELEEDEVLKDIRKREVEEEVREIIEMEVNEASAKSFEEGVEKVVHGIHPFDYLSRCCFYGQQ